MELVYLWVEKYKNIKKQGFNFSPRFECNYDEELNKLAIDEKEDYVNIFPDNINITAIVGENGSGKSKLLNALSHDNHRFTLTVYIKDNKKYTLLLNNFKKITIINKTKYDLHDGNVNDLNITAFNLSNELDNDFIYNNDLINHTFIEEKESKKLFLKYKFVEKRKINFDFMPFNFNPEFISITSSEKYKYEIAKFFDEDSFSDFIKGELSQIKYKSSSETWNKINVLLCYIRETVIINDKLSKEFSPYYWDFIDLCKKILLATDTLDINHVEIKLKSFDETLKLPDNKYFNILDSMSNNRFYSIKKLIKEKVLSLLFDEKYFNIFEINIADKNKERTFFNLSKGEKHIHSLFIKLYSEIMIGKESIFLLDEIELTLHPQLQKKLINMLTKFFENHFPQNKLHYYFPFSIFFK